jgi:hypothetical protein
VARPGIAAVLTYLPAMAHLIEPFRDASIADVIGALSGANDFLVERARAWATAMPAPGPAWGCTTKRTDVDLAGPGRPAVIGKTAERFVEVVNMIATVERLLGALQWFGSQAGAGPLVVAYCHPTTSSSAGATDLALIGADGGTVALCEVCDVAAAKAAQNGKEKKALLALGCAPAPPADGVRRYICTSNEYARALAADRRSSAKWHHCYKAHPVGDAADTFLVEVLPLAVNRASFVVAATPHDP